MNYDNDELKGYECVVIGGTNGVDKCYVAHATREKGVTLHDFKTDQETFCINAEMMRKNALRWGSSEEDFKRVYDEIYDRLVEEILKGEVYDFRVYYLPTLRADYENTGFGLSFFTCPYK